MNFEPDLSALSPAKINLFLHVVGQREDGYHLLQTAFRLLDHGDQLNFKRRSDGQIHRVSELAGVPPEADLVVRAARLLQAQTGCQLGVDIYVDKRLPMGGGLGGGSSNAACVLLALNRLWNIHATRDQLQHWGLALGADVPFFIFGRDAFAEGVGEALQIIDIPQKHYVVIEPPVQVSTPEIFSAKQLTRDHKPVRMPAFVAHCTEQQLAAHCGQTCNSNMQHGLSSERFGNDLQTIACQRYPVIASAIQALNEYQANPKQRAIMSGSGACVFIACDDANSAQQLVNALTPTWVAWAAPTLMRHPLYHFADEFNSEL